MMKRFYLMILFALATLIVNGQESATFDDLALEPSSFWNGSDGSGQFTNGSFTFLNDYNAAWFSWSGFSYTNQTDVTTPGWANQYSAITGVGNNGSANYATAYCVGTTKTVLDNPSQLTGVYVTNSTYTYLSMRDGDSYAKKFGGDLGCDPDYLKLVIYGIDKTGDTTGIVEFYLADFRSGNSFLDYIVDSWTWVDLNSLGTIKELHFAMESTDNSSWGMNTPAYFCLDDLNGEAPLESITGVGDLENLGLGTGTFYNGSDMAGGFTSNGFNYINSYIPDWYSWSGFAASTMTDTETRGYGNQYSAITGSGVNGSKTYAVSYIFGTSEISFPETQITGFYVTNNAYAYWSMKEGDAFTKKFGGTTGQDPDWFKLTITGLDADGEATGTIDFYLADFRSEWPSGDYIVDDWEWVDLSSLGVISKLQFSLSSSDNGAWGINTPAYFCLDQLNDQDQAPVVINPIEDIGFDKNPSRVFTVSLDSVFTDFDSPVELITYKIESISNPDLVDAMLIKEGKTTEQLSDAINFNIARDITGESSVTISATSNGKKTYHTFKVVVTYPTKLDDLLSETTVNVYPNPFFDRITVTLPENAQKVMLTSLSGKAVYFKEVNFESNIEIDDLSHLPGGVYLINIVANNQLITKKLIKR